MYPIRCSAGSLSPAGWWGGWRRRRRGRRWWWHSAVLVPRAPCILAGGGGRGGEVEGAGGDGGRERREWKPSDVGGAEGPKLLLLRVVAKTQAAFPGNSVLSHLPQHRLSLVWLSCKEICLTPSCSLSRALPPSPLVKSSMLL